MCCQKSDNDKLYMSFKQKHILNYKKLLDRRHSKPSDHLHFKSPGLCCPCASLWVIRAHR